MNQDFSQNLRLLCSYYKSIAEVCRRLDINRPQFNRYLSGRYLPSSHTMKKICDFFGVEEHEILLPHGQFERLVAVRPSVTVSQSSRLEVEHLEKLQAQSGAGMDKYLGYYFEYYYSLACPGKILRTLICFERREDGVFYQRTERLDDPVDKQVCHSRYLGVAYALSDRIFMVDYEALMANQLTQTILFPTFRSRVTRLSGLRMGASASGERMPSCARVVLEYLGRDVNLRKALAMCGLYEDDSDEIDDSLKQAIANDMEPGEWNFRARH